jgi:methylglyoxal synthase
VGFLAQAPRPHVAIIAHDGKKADVVAFATYNRGRLKACYLLATSTTGHLLHDKVGLDVHCLKSGPLGGDAQMASRVVEGEVDAVIFIVDPLGKHPHDPDIQTLLRICNVHDVPLATNIATADILMGSELLWEKASVRASIRRNRRLSGPISESSEPAPSD